MIKEQYELVSGAWPSDKQELLLVLDKNNEITDITQYSLGLVSGKEMQDITLAAMRGTPIEIIDRKWSYEDILGLRLKLALPTDFYKDDDGDGVYEDISEDEVMMNMILSNAMGAAHIRYRPPEGGCDLHRASRLYWLHVRPHRIYY